MNEEFQTVVNENLLGGRAPTMPEPKLSPEAHAALMSGLNFMGPGMHKRPKQDAEQPAVKL